MSKLNELAAFDADELAANCTPAMRAALERYTKGTQGASSVAGFQSFINPNS